MDVLQAAMLGVPSPTATRSVSPEVPIAELRNIPLTVDVDLGGADRALGKRKDSLIDVEVDERVEDISDDSSDEETEDEQLQSI